MEKNGNNFIVINNRLIRLLSLPVILAFVMLTTTQAQTGNNFSIPDYRDNLNEYILFSNMKTSYRIVLDEKASESEQWAAFELQHWLNEISGAYFPIENLNRRSRGPRIILGYNDTIKKITQKPAPADLDESYHYHNSGSDIIIYGGKQRGTMYGVMSFLENELGCRWYTPSVTVIPKREELKFVSFNHTESPGIRVRNNLFFEALDPIWSARNKMNGRTDYRQQPGGVECYWRVHTFNALVPPSEFFEKHPEYFSLIDGKRLGVRTQLCLSNPDVLKITIERIKSRMRESPEYLIYDVSQNDWLNPCQCDECQKIVIEEGSEAGIMIWFVNKVAKAVEKEFPDKFIGTLAYQYTRTTPRNVKPHDNVVVRLCTFEACLSHDLKSCPENQSFMADLKGWSAISPHIYIWDYVVNFSDFILPFPNFNVLQSNIKTFQENSSIGIMEEGAYACRGGEFSELKTYLISRLLWNPDCNTEDVINDFMYGFYGRAGKYIRQYFDLLQSMVTPEMHLFNWRGLKPGDPVFSDDFIQKSSQIFQNAEKVADNIDILRRVEMVSLQLLYLKCKQTPALAVNDGTYEKFCNIAKREGITRYAEFSETLESFHSSVEGAK